MVTKNTFDAFETARLSGNYNMITDAALVMREYNISRQEYRFILENYENLVKLYK